MRERHDRLNIPVEIIRTIVAVMDLGSLTKAGRRLGISQSAISAQMKRIENILGGHIFSKSAGGSSPTKLGVLVVMHARRMLAENDQIVRLRGDKIIGALHPIRLGISNLYVREYLRQRDKVLLGDVIIHTGDSADITKRFVEGHIDIACVFQTPELSNDVLKCIVAQAEEQFVWVRSKGFTLSPGVPIPILTLAGSVSNDIMIDALLRQDLSYRIAFHGEDYQSQLFAAEAGLGLTIIPRRMIPPDLVEAKEFYLPQLRKIKVVICAKPDQPGSRNTKELIQNLSSILSPTPLSDEV
ncbi:MAG: LysR family transcriptional regulator [Tardiphaga sp.]|jgi:DNA-binding transcriptional LysR family regulator|nr:LysR family transcriptional regulator [Tardiphaga sp.]